MTPQPTVSERPKRFRWQTGGRGRLLTIAVSLGLIAVVGVTIWRARSLDGLPDVGDPFDVAEARRTVELPDADNAFVAYAAAARLKLMNPRNSIALAIAVRRGVGRRDQGAYLVLGRPSNSRLPGSQTRGD